MNDRILPDGNAQSWYRFRGHRYADVERLVTAVLRELPQETERPPQSRVVRALSNQLIRDGWVKDVIDYENIPESKMLSGETEDDEHWTQSEVRSARARVAATPRWARPLVTRDTSDRTPAMGCPMNNGGLHSPGSGRAWEECDECDEWPYVAPRGPKL